MAYGDVEQSFTFRFSNTQDFRFSSGGSLYGFWVDANNFYVSGTNRLPRTSSVKKMLKLPIPGSSASGTISTTIADSVTVDQPDLVGIWADATNLYAYGTFVGPSPSYTLYRRVWKYRLSDLTYISRFDFSNLPANYGWYSEHAFWSDGTTFWGLVRVRNTTTAKAYAWNASGNRVTSKDVTFTNPWASFGEAKDSHRVQGFFATSDKWYLLLSEWESGQSYKARIVPFLKSNVNVVEDDIIIFPAGENVREVRVDSTGNFLWTLSANGSFDAKFQKISFERVVAPPVPGVPTGLTGTAGNKTVTLSWNTVSGATAYSVEYRAGTSGDWTLHSDSIVVNGVTVSGLTNSQAYQFRIRAENSGGNSNWTTPISVTPVAPPVPAAVTGLSAVAGNTQVTVRWTAVTEATSYELMYGISGQSLTTVRDIQATFYVITGLTNAQSYNIIVRAVNANGKSPASSVTATPVAPPVPAVPVPVLNGVNRSINVRWPGVEHATDYEVQYRPGTSGNYQVWRGTLIIGLVGLIEQKIAIITGLTNGQPYQVRVRSIGAHGNSDWSALQSATPVAPAPIVTVPDTPSGLVGTSDDMRVVLTWNATNGATAYSVEYRRETEADWQVHSNTLQPTTATIRGLTNGFFYLFRILASNSAGKSGWTSEIRVKPQAEVDDLVTPTKPTGVLAEGGDRNILIVWNESENAVDYTVNYRKSAVSDWTVLSSKPTNNTVTLSSLENDVSYEIRIRANNSVGSSGWSEVITATPTREIVAPIEVIPTPETPPAIPSNLEAIVGKRGDVYVTWQEAPRAAHYNLRYRVKNGQWIEITNVPDENYEIVGLENDVEYQIAVQARNAFGVSRWTEPIDITGDVDAQLLAVPTGLQARGGNGFAELTFDLREEMPEYQVRVKKVGGDWREVVTYYPTDYPFIVDRLDNETSYEIQLREDNLVGVSDWTSSVTVKPVQGLSGKPEPIQDFSGIGGNEHVEFNWYDPNGGGQIEIQGRLQGDTVWDRTVTMVSPRRRSIYPPFSEDGLSNGVWYEFRIRAWNKHGNSDWSPILEALPNSVYARVQKPVTKERMIVVYLANSDYGICSGSVKLTLANRTKFGIFKDREYLPWIQTSEETISESVHQTSASNPSINLSIPIDKSVEWIRDRRIGEEISIAYLERSTAPGEANWDLTEYGVLGLIEELQQDSSGFSFSLISPLERFTKRDVKRWSDHAHQTEYEGDLWFSKLAELSVSGEHVVLIEEDD